MLLRKIFTCAGLAVVAAGLFFGCKDSEDSTTFTGLKLSVSQSVAAAGSEVTVKATYYKEDAADSSADINYSLSSDTTGGAFLGTSGTTAVGKSGADVKLTLGSSGNAFVTVTASCNGASASAVVKTAGAMSVNDIPSGYASVGFASFYNASKVKTVTTKSELVNYAKQGGYTIIVDGMIDMSEGMLPSTGGGSNELLDAFVKANSSYSTYSAYNEANCKSIPAGDDWTNPLNSAYGNIVRLTVASNTAIIGKSANCGIKGGSIFIKNASNVILRNLVIQDGYDPFPNYETGDGWNGQQDNVHIEKSTNVWVDHCTIEDTLTLVTGANGEKWQTYDGLCDITNLGSSPIYVTVSNCILRNHDKTILIGSSDSDGSYSASTADESKVKRFVTLSGNYFKNCGQRLPMVRNTLVHIYNNVYETSGSPYASQSAVNTRSGSISYAENNYFGSGLKYSFNAASTNTTKPILHASGNSGTNANATSNISATDSKKFSDSVNAYTYSSVSAEEARSDVLENAGAGCTLRE